MKSILFNYYPLYVNFSHSCSLLTAICKQQGVNADYAPLDSEWIERMTNYDIIGFSFVTDVDYIAAIPYMKVAKASGKEIIAGGVYARRGGIVENADIVCRGEAEPITDYIKHTDLSIFHTPHYQASIDGLPMPDLCHITGYEFQRGFPFLEGVKIIPYQTSRGCGYGKCSFCDVQFQPRGVRIKHTIAEDMARLNDTYHPDLFYLMDEWPPYYSSEWREQWAKINFPFQCYIRADIEPEHLDFMIAHGLKVCAFGIESGNETYRNEVLKKGLTDKQIMRTAKMLQKHDIKYVPFYMVNTPGETPEYREDTLRMIRQVGGFPMAWEYQDLSASIKDYINDNSASYRGGYSQSCAALA